MIKMHCDRCDKSDAVHWTKGREVGVPIIPENWGEVKAPESPSSLVTYVLCDDCLVKLHIWIKNDVEEIDAELYRRPIGEHPDHD